MFPWREWCLFAYGSLAGNGAGIPFCSPYKIPNNTVASGFFFRFFSCSPPVLVRDLYPWILIYLLCILLVPFMKGPGNLPIMRPEKLTVFLGQRFKLGVITREEGPRNRMKSFRSMRRSIKKRAHAYRAFFPPSV